KEYTTDGLTATALYTYYNNADNYMESATYYDGPDENGYVYYHWIDDMMDLKDVKVLASQDSDGAIAYYTTFYLDTPMLDTVVGYASADYTTDPSAPSLSTKVFAREYSSSGGGVSSKILYYQDEQNRMASKSRPNYEVLGADAEGNIYYHFRNEAFYDNSTPGDATDDYGRMDYKVAQNAGDYSAESYWYEYNFTGDYSASASKEIAYIEGDIPADERFPDFSGRTKSYSKDYTTSSGGVTATDLYTYYTDGDNRLQSRTIYTDAAEKYYHYMNDAAQTLDGKVLKEANGSDFYAIGYLYEYTTGAVKTYDKGYKSVDYTTNANAPVYDHILVERKYSTDGITPVRQQTWYYDTGTAESVIYYVGDDGGSPAKVYQHYSTNGLTDYEKLASLDADGALAYYYEYYGDDTTLKKKVGYSSLDTTDVQQPVGGRMVYSAEYTTNGDFDAQYTYYDDADNRMASRKTAAADASGNLYYHFLNESFGGNAWGRMNYRVAESADAYSAKSYYREYNFTGDYSSSASKETGYVEGDMPADERWPDFSGRTQAFQAVYTTTGGSVNTQELLTYYTDASNRIQSKTMYYDANDLYYHYLNADGYILDGKVMKNSDSSDFYARAYKYEYIGTTKTYDKGYKSALYTTDPNNPTYNDILVQRQYSTDGSTVMNQQTWYYDPYQKESEVYYHGSDDGSGRVYVHYSYTIADTIDKEVMSTVQSADNSTIAYEYEYWGDNTTVKKKTGYKSAVYTNVSSPSFSTKAIEHTYTSGGAWESTTWYRDNGNPLKKLVNTGEAAIYFDTDTGWYAQTYWNGSGQIDYYNTEADYHDGKKAWWFDGTYKRTYDYYDSGRIKYVNFYYDNSGTWTWLKTEVRADSGDIPYGDWITDTDPRPATVPETVEDLPEKPAKTGLESLDDDTASLIVSDEEVLSNEMGEFYDKLETLKSEFTGEGVTVALLDAGIDTSKLDIDLLASVDLADGLGAGFGHADLTAGVISETASEAGIIDIDVFNSNGETDNSIVAGAVKYAVDMGAKVLAMPFSLFPMTTTLEAALEYAADKGAILIASAGNEGTEVLDKSLASSEKVITVGSVDSDGKLSAWSNYGSEVDLYAPWDVIEGEAGTSVSAALVAGITALMLEDDSDMTADEVLAELEELMAETLEQVEEEVKAEEKEEKEIKGISVDEVVSRYDAIRKNRADFTGHSIQEDVPDAGLVK
ncbi:MAG: S8 family serine peptidase, partial [Candidatus Omnitrophica bacterium]|nr:S8 family serine peptidase [Candidatus Omnitrophota bacterium]